MTHTIRCRNAKSLSNRCRCSCNGTQHGLTLKKAIEDLGTLQIVKKLAESSMEVPGARSA